MTHLGIYFAPEHGIQADLDYIAALQPPVVRILDPDVQQIATVHALAPNAIVAPRTWAIDDNNGAAVRNLVADPIATGRDHAQQFRGQLDRWQSEARSRGLALPPVERILFSSANEPNQGGTPDKIAAYSIAFLDRCTELGIRACAPCLGVGWPGNTGPDTPVDWSPYAGLDQAIRHNGGMLSVHEYFYKSGPQDGWRWLAGRHLQCPFDVPILLGEIGIDNYVDKARWDREGGNRGWQGHVSPDVYAEMIEYHIRHSDRRVVAALIFITDYRSNSWESFNTRSAHNALLARKDRMVPQGTPSFDLHLPSISTPPTPPSAAVAYVQAPAGANIRQTPDVRPGNIITAVAYGEPVTVAAYQVAGNGTRWAQVTYQSASGWMVADLLGETQPTPAPAPQPEPTPQPQPVGDSWQRSIAFVLQHEGGWADDPNDVGGATMRGITIGTYTRWRQAHGQPPPTKDDLRNISDAEVRQIYFEWYWQASGSDKMPWPLCLAHFDLAVNGGVGRAQEALNASGGDFIRYCAWRLNWYTRLDGFVHFGRAWTRRVADLMQEATQ